MTVRVDVLKLVREKRKEVARLEKQLARYEAKRRRLAALKAELRAIAATARGDAPLEMPTPRRGVVGGRRARAIRNRSGIWWAAKVLNLVGEPMHIDKIIDRIRRESGKTFEKPSVVSGLSRYIQNDDTFMRHGPNVFGLIDFTNDVDKKTEEGQEGKKDE